MTTWKLGLALETLGLPARPSIEKAAEIGAESVQFDAVGDFHPESLSTTGRRELRVKLTGHNLELAAIQVPLRRGLDQAERQQERIDHVKSAMSFAADLGCRIISVPMPKLSAEPSPVLHDSVTALTAYGDRVGVWLALEAGLDSAEALRNWLAGFHPAGVAFDPANFLANGFDPVASAAALADTILHVKARDIRKGVSGAREMAVGAGDVDWLALMPTLSAVAYRGSIVVDREPCSNRAADAINGMKFLRRFMNLAEIR